EAFVTVRGIAGLEIIGQRCPGIRIELVGQAGAQPGGVVGAILVLEVAAPVTGVAGEADHRAQRARTGQPRLIELFVAVGTAGTGAGEAAQPDGVATASVVGTQPERARARRLVVEGEGIVLVESLSRIL